MKMPLIALVACLLSASLFAQTPSQSPETSSLDRQIASLQIDVPRLREIVNLVAADEDQPSKQIHDEFWGLILTRIQADPKTIGAAFDAGMNKGLVLQVAFWESLRLSAQSKRVVITDEFARLRNNYPKSEITSDYAKAQNEMLNAAATGQPFLLRNGQPSYITVEIADLKLARMNALRARFKILHDPNWSH